MQIKRTIIILLGALAFTTTACKKSSPSIVIDTHKGVVLYNICGNIVVQSTGPTFLGESNWVDENNPSKPTYDHVFTVSNACDFGNYSSGDTITFALISPRPQTCARCLIYIATPATNYNVQVLK